ncbi:protein DEHYDRATION-INDUCED 19 homolog 2-like isoform X1 [Ananas comosus]|uniref:Protein DEHYDRATION-INDUCED 19 homolog 2-like isoform X1 n=1 Tax=Ananas comosus TaxID=4615 RepID=A0A6P5EUV7_ANACO|nr:protein DEHYDRATION-INDUCED 19 homolog 2-like isoform X1 [Ananas comosus]
MEADSWSRLSAAASKRLLQSRYDLYLGFEEVDGEDDESRAEFNCPFCAEDFDFVGLCCHIDDEHHVEAKNGVCPICAERVGMDLVGHMTMQHGSYFKLQRRRRFRKASTGSHSLLSLLRKDLRDGNLQALLGGSSCTAAPSAVAPDPLLSSLVYNLPIGESPKGLQAESLDNAFLINDCSDEKVVERKRTEPSLSDKDQEERARRSELVQELVLSSIFDNTL